MKLSTIAELGASKANISQIRAINRILKFWEDGIKYSLGVAKLTWELEPINDFRLLSLVCRVERTDCEPYSARAILCQDGGHFIIGSRGRITVCSTNRVCSDADRKKDYLKHIAFMVRGKVSK